MFFCQSLRPMHFQTGLRTNYKDFLADVSLELNFIVEAFEHISVSLSAGV
jgi:hypothetical protein